ncbi:hypothetical protein F5884DRAFT_857208 [Xylogone sp. PMI_703]|nr:hypothetical protein F5884DRAFT_857208 [Xylogone sp. PMI_703]
MTSNQPGIVQVTWFKPDVTDPAKTKERLKEGLEKLAETPGFERFIFEGTHREQAGISVRITQWSSAEDHADNFATIFGNAAEHVKTFQYQMHDPYPPLSPNPEAVELMTLTLRPDIDFREFYDDWSAALKDVAAFKGCRYIALGRGIEAPRTAVQIQPWQTLEDHITGFQKSPECPSIMVKLTAVVDKYVQDGWKGATGGHIMLTDPGEAVLSS